MASKRDRITKYLSEHPGVSLRTSARDLGVNYTWVSRVRSASVEQPPAPAAPVEQRVEQPPRLADGFYQIEDGRPYRITCEPGDVFHVDADGTLQPGMPRRTVEIRAE